MNELQHRIEACYYYDLLPQKGKNLMQCRVASIFVAQAQEQSLLSLIRRHASTENRNIASVTLRDSYLWSPTPDDIDIYVVTTDSQAHKSAFKNLPITVAQGDPPQIKGDIWFVGEGNINDLQRTWLYRRGVTIEGNGFCSLPTSGRNLYLAFALSKLIFEAAGFLQTAEYRKSIHRLVSAAFYGSLLHEGNSEKSKQHLQVAKQFLAVMHSDPKYGNRPMKELRKSLAILKDWNDEVMSKGPLISVKLIDWLWSYSGLDADQKVTVLTLAQNVFDLFSHSEVLAIIGRIGTPLSGMRKDTRQL